MQLDRPYFARPKDTEDASTTLYDELLPPSNRERDNAKTADAQIAADTPLVVNAPATATDAQAKVDVSKLSLNEKLTALGEPQSDRAKAVKESLDQWHIKYTPPALLDMLSLHPEVDNKPALTALSGLYNFDSKTCMLTAGLGAGKYADRERAQRQLESKGTDAIPVVSVAAASKDAEIVMRSHLLMRYYLKTAATDDLAKYPQALSYLSKEPLTDRFDQENRKDPDKLIALAKDVDILRQQPNFVKAKCAELDAQQDSMLGSERLLVRNEWDRWKALDEFARDIRLSQANITPDFAQKRSLMLEALRIHPASAKSQGHQWAFRSAKLFEDEAFMKEFVKLGGDPALSEIPKKDTKKDTPKANP